MQKGYLKAEIVTNETGEVIERQEFKGAGAKDQMDAWVAMRRQAGEQIGMFFGPEFERDIMVEDLSADYNKKLEIEDRRNAREFCLWVIDVIAAYNKKFASDAQMQSTFSTPAFQGIILALLTGATKTARGLIAQAGPMLYPPDFVAQVLTAMDAQLAKEDPEAEAPPAPEGNGDEESQEPDEENPPEDESSSEPV